MDQSAQEELYQIKRELQSIINELESISRGVRSEFVGIGSDKCASCITSVVTTYKKAKRRIDNIDTSKVTNEYAVSHNN